ncbi:hypothetical protein QBC41DRAFT_335128 [Cercophora samala]|uniref:Uncharacterized protein n=1 Tax=Cercophora samala TaxID=330535 RepID=A0AA40DCG1_9PEZI|nr:hypothetical protein QBC41DRAFT_335128 [Cercophora samala]
MAKVCDSTNSAESVDDSLITPVIEKIHDITESMGMPPNSQPKSTLVTGKMTDVAGYIGDDLPAVPVESPLDPNADYGHPILNDKDIYDDQTEEYFHPEYDTDSEPCESQRMFEQALKCIEHVSTPNDFRISVFCDGSLTQDIEEPGAFAVTINKYYPGTKEHGERIGVAWPMKIALASGNAEGTALLQGIEQVRQEIKEMFSCRSIPAEKLPRERLKVDLYSDGQGVVTSIKETKRKIADAKPHGGVYKLDPKASVVKHVSLRIVQEEERLRMLCAEYDIKNVEINYNFVNGHAKIHGNTEVDILANRARKTTQPVFTIKGQVQATMPSKFSSVYPSLMHFFLKAKALKIAHKAKKGKAKTKAKVAAGLAKVKETVSKVVSSAQDSKVTKSAKRNQKKLNKEKAKALVEKAKSRIAKMAGKFKD